MARGATVFKNTGCDGKTDLCFKYKGSVYEIDVKLASWTHDGKGHFSWRSVAARNVKHPVYPLIVVPATGANISGWYCKWNGARTGPNPPPNCPPGLENFWE